MWSTRQLAELAGVTHRAVRHWHEQGLLPEPTRLSNGYKQYDAEHLVVALRIARLAALGFSLDNIAEMLESDEHAQTSLRRLRSELDERILELRKMRRDVDGLIASGGSPDLSPEARVALGALGTDKASRNISILLARLFSKEDLLGFAATLQNPAADMERFNQALFGLPADASADEIEIVCSEGVTAIDRLRAEVGEDLPSFDTQVGEEEGARAVRTLMEASMNPAQRKVLERILEEFG
ncbi:MULTISPECIES: MerR family transcriptional regulator [Corynebacterium]|uniref:helix-turn-helix domain-containing protein n=1 Tax=Corynebacterium TaxID=1716 RepID=UPI00257C30BD|nr:MULTISPECIES: MerR family transcriptional regulator [Corynebacterium]